MEFELSTDLEKEMPQIISFNKSALVSELNERTEKYRNLIVSEDAITAAKSDRAALNRLKTALDDKRKEVKKACLAPYEAFEKDIKEVILPLETAMANIDTQTKAFEEKEKADKRKAIEEIYTENIGELAEIAPLDAIFNFKWLNKGTTLASVTDEIVSRVAEICNDLTTISSLKSEYELQIKAEYLKFFSLSKALIKQKELECAKKTLEAAKQLETPKAVEVMPNSPTVIAEIITGALTGTTKVEYPQNQEIKDVRALFLNTTEAFRTEMRELCAKHNIKVKSL